jgi:chromosome condensin MukBEF MukE localization factor
MGIYYNGKLETMINFEVVVGRMDILAFVDNFIVQHKDKTPEQLQKEGIFSQAKAYCNLLKALRDEEENKNKGYSKEITKISNTIEKLLKLREKEIAIMFKS